MRRVKIPSLKNRLNNHKRAFIALMAISLFTISICIPVFLSYQTTNTNYFQTLFLNNPQNNNNINAKAFWLSGWEYCKSHTLSGSTAGAQTNYQTMIVVHYSSGSDNAENIYCKANCRTDFGDIRFTNSDGTSQLNYWMESEYDGDNATFWVQVDSIPVAPNNTTIYVYYGKNDATTTSNGTNTFPFFDHFDDNILDTNKWNIGKTGGAYSESGTELTILGNGGLDFESIGARVQFSKPRAFYFRAKAYGQAGGQNAWQIAADERSATGGGYSGFGFDIAEFALDYYQVWTDDSAGMVVRRTDLSSYHILKIIWKNDVQFFENDILTAWMPGQAPKDNLGINFGARGTNTSVTVDWCFVRNLCDPEPIQGAWGSEEEIWNDTIITDTQIIYSKAIILNGNLTIASGGSLTLTNDTLMVNCTTNGEHGIEVQSGGALYINDSDGNPNTINDATNITAYNPDNTHNFLFRVQPGATFQMNNSELQYCGYNYTTSNYDYYGLWISTNNAVIENNTFTNNYVGITLYSAYNNTLLGNTVNNNINDGFSLSSSSNNTLLGNTANNNTQYGFYLNSSSNNTLTSNTAKYNYWGFDLDHYSNNNILLGNTANDNGAFGWRGNGFDLNHYSNNNTLSSNTAYHNGWDGFFLSSSSNNTLSSNTANLNYYLGFGLSSSSNNNLTSNTVTNNNYYGFYLSSSSNNNTLSSNTATNSTYGFYLFSCLNNTITGNAAVNNAYGFYLEAGSSGNDLTGSIVSNYLSVKVLGYDGGAVQGADVKVEVDGNPLYASPGFGGINSSTDQNGLTDLIIVPYQTFTSGAWVGNTTVVTVKFKIMSFLNNPRIVDISSSHIENFTATPTIWGDTTISDSQNISNTQIILNGNLTIAGGGSLTLTSVTLFVNCSTNGEHGIEVKSGGALYINDSDGNPLTTNDATVITAYNKDNAHNFVFWVQPGATFQMNNSEIHYCGYSNWPNKEDCGPCINTDNAVIENNTFSNNYYGILLWNAYYNIIRNNNVTNNSNDGFFLDSSSNNQLINNTISYNNMYGLYLWFGSNNNNISGNTATNNVWDGFNIYNTYNNTLTGNTASNNNYGFDIFRSTYSKLMSNFAINNGDGFYMYDSSNNTLSNNTANNNGDGFFLSQSSNNTLSCNTANNNGAAGFFLEWKSNNNTLTDNTLVNNRYGFNLDGSNLYIDFTGSVVANYLCIEVLDKNENPVQGADVKVEVDGNVVYASPEFGGSNSTTNQSGLTDWFIVPYQTYVGGTPIYNAARVTASFFGLNITDNKRTVYMSSSHKETFVVEKVDSSITTSIGAGINKLVNVSVQMGVELTINLTNPVNLSIIKIIDNLKGNTPFGLNFLGRFVSIEVDNTTAIQGINITIHYTDQEVTGNNLKENSLAIWYWNETSGNWIQLPSTVDIQNNTITGYTNHLTYFAILGTPVWYPYIPLLILFLNTPSGLNPLIYLTLGLVAVAGVTVATLGLRRGRREEEQITETEAPTRYPETAPQRPASYTGTQISPTREEKASEQKIILKIRRTTPQSEAQTVTAAKRVKPAKAKRLAQDLESRRAALKDLMAEINTRFEAGKLTPDEYREIYQKYSAKLATVEKKLGVITSPTPDIGQRCCMFCGTEIQGDEKYCPNCGGARLRCPVCQINIVSGDQLVKCPCCGALSHKDHLLEWIKIKGTCPSCEKKLSQLDIV
ncbi:MAG: DUF2341 domain-containing protein [Candidatus Freyarchaeum deiterrae]